MADSSPKPPLDYATPPVAPDDGLTPRQRRAWSFACIMAYAWPLVACAAGVGSDHLRIPIAKKISLGVGALVILIVLAATAPRGKMGCATAFFTVALLMVFVMLFWN